MPDEASYADAPPLVQQMYATLARGHQPGVVRLGRGSGQWVLGVDAGAAAMRQYFVRRRRAWVPGRLQLVVNGVDLSHQADGAIDKAMQLMQSAMSSTAGDSAVNPSTAATPISSAASRKGTVMRN